MCINAVSPFVQEMSANIREYGYVATFVQLVTGCQRSFRKASVQNLGRDFLDQLWYHTFSLRT